MATTTIYRQQFATTFSGAPEAWTTFDPLDFGYWASLPSAYLPYWYEGEAVKVTTPRRLSVDNSYFGDLSGHSFAGALFYGIGVGDPNRELIPDDGTYAWDQRGVIAEVSYVHSADAFAAENELAFFPILTLGKGSIGAEFGVAVWGDGYGANSRKMDITRVMWPSFTAHSVIGSYEVTPDDALHRYRIQAEPGTVTGSTATFAGYSVASDGFIRIWVDGVLVYEELNIPLTFAASSLSGYPCHPTLIRVAELGFAGMMGDAADFHLYRESGIVGSFVAGKYGHVRATRAALFSLNDDTNYNDTAGLFKVAGDAEITGSFTVGGETIAGGAAGISAALDTLGT